MQLLMDALEKAMIRCAILLQALKNVCGFILCFNRQVSYQPRLQVRFELTFYALNPELKVVAPWREWDITGREDAIEYAKKHNVPVPVTKKSIYSRDRNLWHLSHEVPLPPIPTLHSVISQLLLFVSFPSCFD